MPAAPLDGVRVLDLTHYIAGPYCTKLLATYGAQVLKIERPPAGDPARRIGPFFQDMPGLESSALYLHLNTNKQSLTLDLKSADGQAIVRRLLLETDIVVENFRPGVLTDLGLDYATLKAINPAIVLTSISNFGQTGPYRDLKASEIVESAMGGPMNITGHPDREPLKLGGNVVQYHAGAMAAYATVMALLRAEADGTGDWIDISIYETQCTNRDRRVIYLLGHAYTGETGKRQAFGHRALSGVRQTSDGYVSLVGAGTRLPGLLRMMGQDDLLDDPRVQEAVHHTSAEVMAELEALYSDWLLSQPKNEVVAKAQAAHVLAAPLNTIADLFTDPHFEARDPWELIDSEVTGPIRYPGQPFQMSESPAVESRRAPTLGEHNAPILCGQLGYEREDLSRLEEQGGRGHQSFGRRTTSVAPNPSVQSPQSSVRELPLEGLRVLDVTVVWAGPHCTQLLAEWGAEVIRVEPLKHIQPATRGAENRLPNEAAQAMRGNGLLLAGAFPDRDPGGRPWNRSPVFNSHAHNKRSMTLDLMEPGGLELFKELVAISDVVVENNAPDTIERAQITYEKLAAINPRLIMLRISAFGLSGPYKYYRNYGTQIEAAIGHHLIRSYTDLEPTMTGDAYTADAAGGVQGALAVLLALRHLRRTGQGQMIELSLAESFMPYLGEIILDYTMNGRAMGPQGNQHASHAPHGAYPCRGDDRWIAIDVQSDQEWEVLCEELGMAQACADPRFATGLSRWHNRQALDAIVAAHTVSVDDRDLFARLQSAGVAAGPVQDEADVYACPQLAARGFFQRIKHPDAGEHLYPGYSFRLEDTPNSFKRPACLLGQDNDYVYRDLLDVSDDKYERLKSLGHIGTAYPGYACPDDSNQPPR